MRFQTGERAEESTIYSSSCCSSKLILGRGEIFPACTVCKRRTSWAPILEEFNKAA